MSLDISYSIYAEETLQSVYDFIYDSFGSASADKFTLKADSVIKRIAKNPFMFKASSIDENVRVALITKQTSLLYLVTKTTIYLLFFWDNRQEPFFM